MTASSRANGRSLRRTLTRLVAMLALVLAILIAVTVTGTILATNNYRSAMVTTISEEQGASLLLTDLLDADINNRGYIFTGRGDYLRPYLAALRSFPADLADLRQKVSGDPVLSAQVDDLERLANNWFVEARRLVALRRRGNQTAAIRRINRRIARGRSDAFRRQYNVLAGELERRRVESLENADRLRTFTIAATVAASLLALLVVAFGARRLWQRVGGPVALIARGVNQVARGRMGDVPASPSAVRELAELTSGFNLMQRQVFQQREAVTAAVRREAAQRTERRLWETVQEGLLPARLPVLADHRLVARYRPAERALLIGGDFYDAEMLPDGRLAMIVGDMAGHGAPAAAQAAGLRFGWRTMVAVDPHPARVLSALNAQMARPELRAEGLFATVIYTLVTPEGEGIFASAGHPSPVLLDGEGCHVLEPAGVGPVLGLLDEGEWPFTPFTLPPGATYVTYTDGLVEARAGEEVFGLERVCGILTAERNVAVEARLARLVAAARRFDDGSLRDDVVVMALERVPPVHV